ncbi:MAG: carboxypeptidase regulatory-like domain-containing protein, partial [Acidobacteriota bacterium]|nr:carboxypeptidase regulatory-like domain-containing protein [Acidobacteriota bacterium]
MYRTVSLICVLSLIAALPGPAQTVLGTMTGHVLDPSGAAIAGAAVTATNTGTNLTFHTTTNENGNYVLQQLPVGVYDLSVETAGFRRYNRRAIELNVAQTLTLDVNLEVGQVEQAVEVSALVTTLQTSTSDLGTTIQRNKLVDLPLFVGGNVRNLEQFIFLAPGVTGDTTNTQISGSPSRAKEVLVDGIASTGVESGGVIPGSGRPSVETIGEFRLIRGNFNAEYGRTGGGVELFTTRSGTNQLHGSLFDYLRNDKFDARGFFQATRPINRQNEFGAVVGGPVFIPKLYNGHNKTFFFFVYSGFRYRQGAPNSLQSIIPLDYRTGDFSRFSGIIYDPETTQSTPTGIVRKPFEGNRIPDNRISPISKKILSVLPTPTNNGLFNNFTSVGRGATNSNQYNIKMDHAFNDRNRLSGYYYQDALDALDPELIPGPATPARANGSRNFWARVSHDFVVSPTVLNHVTLGFTRFKTTIANYSVDQNWPAQLGLTGVNNGPNNSFPCLDFVSSGYAHLGDSNCNSRTLQTNNSFQINEAFSVIRGAHSLKFGADLRFMETNGIDIYQANGVFAFNALETGQPGVPNSGNAIASFLLGAVDSGTLRDFAYYPRNRYKYAAFYAQDDWKATRKLTLNYGLRWDIFFPRSEKNNNLSTFDPTIPNAAAGGRLGALAFLGDGPGRNGRTSFADTYFKAFGPRLGLAYQLNDKTVLRSGYGIYYALGNANAGLRDSLSDSSGFSANPTFASTDAGVTPGFNWNNGFPQNYVRPPVISPTAANGAILRPILRSDGRPPYFQNWSGTVERELLPRTNLEVTYLGTKGTRLGSGLVRLNELDPSYLSLGTLLTRPFNSPQAIAAGIVSPYPGFTGSVAQALRPYPQYLDLLNRSNPSGSSTYHALQTQFSIRALAGLDVQMAYTYSKLISDADVLAGGGPAGQTTYNRRLEKAIATTDVPHIFGLSYSYDLPFGKGRRWINTRGFADAVLGGWVLTGIHQYSTGVPIVLTANNTLPLFTGVLRPDVVSGVARRTDVENFDPNRDRWINPAAFKVPATLQFGTAARSYTDLRNPSYRNENFGLLKKFHVSERMTLTARAEAFNALNHVVFGAPQSNVSNGQFGRITSQANTPRQGQVALR